MKPRLLLRAYRSCMLCQLVETAVAVMESTRSTMAGARLLASAMSTTIIRARHAMDTANDAMRAFWPPRYDAALESASSP